MGTYANGEMSDEKSDDGGTKFRCGEVSVRRGFGGGGMRR